MIIKRILRTESGLQASTHLILSINFYKKPLISIKYHVIPFFKVERNIKIFIQALTSTLGVGGLGVIQNGAGFRSAKLGKKCKTADR